MRTDPAPMPHDAQITTAPHAIAAARVRLLLATVPVSAVTNASVALIAMALLHGGAPAGFYAVWGGVMIGLQAIRLLVWLIWRGASAENLRPVQRSLRLRVLRAASWATGMSWGAIPAALFPASPIEQSFVAFFLAGVSGAAVAGLAFDAWASGLFVVSVIVPLALRLMGVQTSLSTAMAAMVCIYLLYLGVAIRRGQLQFLQLLDWRTRAETARARTARQAQLNALLAEANQLGTSAPNAAALYAAICRTYAALDGQAPLSMLRVVCANAAERLPCEMDDSLRDWLLNLAASVDRGLQAISQRERIDRLQKLYRALISEGEVVLQSRSAEEMLQRTCDTLATDTQFHAAWLARPDDSGAFRVLARAGEGALQLDHFRVHLNDANRVPLVLRVWDTQTLQVCNDLLRDPDMQPWNSTLSRYRWHAALATPVWRGGALWGVLVFTSPQAQAFDEQTIALCEQVAALLGYGLDELDVKERLSHLQRVEAHRARHDTLTGLPNRYALEQYLPEVIARARRQGSLFAVGMIDLDGFKLINDTWGHSAGDRVLRELTRRLQAVQRQTDFLVRLGGDEFVVVMEDLNPLEVQTGYANSVQRLRQAVAAPFDIAPNVQLPIDMSIGISAYPLDAQDADTLMRLADKAMYAAKPKNRTSANSP
ncbi:MAG: GGDEF domain-containing protein [Thiomonas sp. 14-64-326]|nr:MAG: GGDEF domain-containing protein [Thiomonas sp. 14-64-326]